mmetsp:Transcript_957/g.1484  ORF Transcript_957/g.1484 Transcript_957/m.1484 type:complete len:214 (+) Transcript_957:736-1377(+)
MNKSESYSRLRETPKSNISNQAARRIAKMFMPTIPRSHVTQQVMLRKRMKKHKKLASQLRQAEKFRSAIGHYEIALDAVYELGPDHPDHGEALKIRECIADIHSLLGRYEDALMMYSSVKDGYFKVRSKSVHLLYSDFFISHISYTYESLPLQAMSHELCLVCMFEPMSSNHAYIVGDNGYNSYSTSQRFGRKRSFTYDRDQNFSRRKGKEPV